MMNNSFRIVFMGTPEFAIPSLKLLIEEGYTVTGVVTAPDKPAGRGQKLKASPVKKYANKQGIPVLQPDNLKDPKFQQELEQLQPDLQVVVAFRMLPESVFSLPEHGTINLHASLLPQYRGAAPINWVIMNGEEKTGVTTFFIEKQIDTGEILLQEETSIGKEETAGQLHDRLKLMGGKLVVKTVNAIYKGNYTTQSQPKDKSVKKAPKIHKSDCKIDWDQSVDQVYNFIRGLSPYPTAWTTLNGSNFKIYRVGKVHTSHDRTIGAVSTDQQNYFKVAVRGGFIDLKEVQWAGKKKMDIQEFLKGFKNEKAWIK